MRLIGRLVCASLLVLAAASCNTTEALTPQAEVGSGRGSSTPVTQAETDRMARSPRPETYSARAPRAGPQNSLEAQAEALQAGNSTSPASSGPPPQWQGQEQPAQQQTAQQTAQPTEAQAGQAPQQSASTTAAGPSSGTIRFLPIIGAPVQAVTPLSRRLGAQARAGGLTIRPSGDASAEHILKGYFSAFADEGKVTIVYVWDVLDSSGARLNRMQGQASVPAKGDDPWAAVPASTMEEIANKTIADYLAWRQSHPG